MSEQKSCDRCGKANRQQALFCGYCGQPFAPLVPEKESGFHSVLINLNNVTREIQHRLPWHEGHRKRLRSFVLPVMSVMIGTLLGVLVYTNPPPDKYKEFVQQRLIESAKTPEERLVATLFTPLMRWGINALTERKNYYLFSVYKTNLESAGCVKAIGILGNFIVVEVPQTSLNKPNLQPDSS